MPKNVYAVTEGSYEDYRVLALFDEENDADAFCERYSAQQTYPVTPGVEVLKKYAQGEQPRAQPYWILKTLVKDLGEQNQTREIRLLWWDFLPERWDEREPKTRVHRYTDFNEVLIITEGTDYDKTLQDHREHITEFRKETAEFI